MLYPWHPWAGRAVHVHDVIAKAGWAAFRCSLSGVTSDRRLEIPVWMFDRAACQSWQVGVAPVASVAALRALATLLHDAAGVRDEGLVGVVVVHHRTAARFCMAVPKDETFGNLDRRILGGVVAHRDTLRSKGARRW